MSKAFTLLDVIRTEPLTPHVVRVVLGGAGFDAFPASEFTDSYVKLAFGDPQDAPTLRTYTVRHVDPEAREIVLDIVVHPDSPGIASGWAMTVQPGEQIWVRGPGGAYRPDPEADAHLFVGDEAAIPAISAAIESLPPRTRGVAFIEVHGPDDEQPITSVSDVEVHWLHRDGAEAGHTSLLDDAVRAWDWPEGRVQVFVHGESRLLKTVRPYVRERVERRDLSVSAYWRLGETEEGFRAWKATQDEAVLRPEA